MTSLLRPDVGRLSTLSPADLEQFMRDGYVLVRNAFPRSVAEAIIPIMWAASPFKADDRKTWTNATAVVPKSLHDEPIPQIYTPRFWGVCDDLLGAGRYNRPGGTGYLVLNFPGFATPPWKMYGGHVDGNFFHHHLDSREQGLVALFIYSDIAAGGGGTGIRVGSHNITARVLADSEPAGISCGDLCKAVDQATKGMPEIEAIGNAGDMLVMHPFTFHGSSTNLTERPRMASNMCVGLREKMNFNRAVENDYSPVELAVVNALANRK